jgi:hypothetical protein
MTTWKIDPAKAEEIGARYLAAAAIGTQRALTRCPDSEAAAAAGLRRNSPRNPRGPRRRAGWP